MIEPFSVVNDEGGQVQFIAGVTDKAVTHTSNNPLKTLLNRLHFARLDTQKRLWVADSMNHRALGLEKLPSID